MKKLLFVLALVMVYGLAVSTASAKVVEGEKEKVTLVADDNKTVKAEAVKENPTKAKAEAKADGCADKKKTAAACCGK